jgi:hypothetical protein
VARVNACGQIDTPVGVSECTVNWSIGHGDLLCRTGVGKGRLRLEIDIELTGNDITV